MKLVGQAWNPDLPELMTMAQDYGTILIYDLCIQTRHCPPHMFTLPAEVAVVRKALEEHLAKETIP